MFVFSVLVRCNSVEKTVEGVDELVEVAGGCGGRVEVEHVVDRCVFPDSLIEVAEAAFRLLGRTDFTVRVRCNVVEGGMYPFAKMVVEAYPRDNALVLDVYDSESPPSPNYKPATNKICFVNILFSANRQINLCVELFYDESSMDIRTVRSMSLVVDSKNTLVEATRQLAEKWENVSYLYEEVDNAIGERWTMPGLTIHPILGLDVAQLSDVLDVAVPEFRFVLDGAAREVDMYIDDVLPFINEAIASMSRDGKIRGVACLAKTILEVMHRKLPIYRAVHNISVSPDETSHGHDLLTAITTHFVDYLRMFAPNWCVWSSSDVFNDILVTTNVKKLEVDGEVLIDATVIDRIENEINSDNIYIVTSVFGYHLVDNEYEFYNKEYYSKNPFNALILVIISATKHIVMNIARAQYDILS